MKQLLPVQNIILGAADDDGDDGEESHRSGGDGQIDKEDGQDGDHTFFLVKDPFVA